MPADNELEPLDRWLKQQVRPLPPPPGTFELITRRARRRKIRKAVISVAGAVAVAAAVAVAVPVGMSMHLTTGSANANLAAGGSSATPNGGATQSALGPASKEAPVESSDAASGTITLGPTTPGYLPPNFQPYSVTWDSLSTGWIMGPAGTPGHCGAAQNSAICTSIARTDDGGQTWHGLPAPPVGGPMAATGVTGLRFLNASYGWAFGPELWATDDGAEHWHEVDTGGLSVTDLETMNGRAYALFGDCTAPAGTNGDTIAGCRSYTLETIVAGSDNWTPVDGIPVHLTSGTTALASAVLELASPTTGYLVAPDGTLYAGPLDGSAWHKVVMLPCGPGPADTDGLPQALMLTPTGTTSSGVTRLALLCVQIAAGTSSVYLSADNGSTWTKQTGVRSTPTTSVPQSLTALPDGTLILAAIPGGGGLSGGIYLLSPGATQWHPATLSDSSNWETPVGFTYVGMTSATQGVALSSDSSQHAIWMTTDGGKTWQPRPIKS